MLKTICVEKTARNRRGRKERKGREVDFVSLTQENTRRAEIEQTQYTRGKLKLFLKIDVPVLLTFPKKSVEKKVSRYCWVQMLFDGVSFLFATRGEKLLTVEWSEFSTGINTNQGRSKLY